MANSNNQINEELEKGPLVKRGCTDILCTLIFLIFWGFILFICMVAITKGNSSRILRATDNYGSLPPTPKIPDP